MTKKQQKVWAYKVKHPLATASEVAKATKTSYGYVYKLMQKIGTPKDVPDAGRFHYKPKPVAKTDSNADLNPVTPPRPSSRGSILDTAKEYVTKDRAADHGDMEDNFQRIAAYWNTHLGLVSYIKDTDVAVMMALLKVARIHSNVTHEDNWIDACGYLSCGGELAGKD
tara:strand:- start:651 stop:1154 length:504 start_codon:yes stop_codon:yes gene_type:complete